MLFPVYNEKNQIIDIIDLTSDSVFDSTKDISFIGWNILFNLNKTRKKNFEYADGPSELYVTDSVLNALTISHTTKAPTVVMNTVDLSPQVSLIVFNVFPTDNDN